MPGDFDYIFHVIARVATGRTLLNQTETDIREIIF
jgi:hypothetical protein